jgi:hypothetical protein
MAFVKLDTGILNSTLWIERECREIFITALLMAEPREFSEPTAQIAIRTLDFTGFAAPPGWYGFVPAASVGIIRRAGLDREEGMDALIKLGDPEDGSRSKDFGGRRLIRIDGGFMVLNFMKYRDKDHTAAVRQQRLRDRRKAEKTVTRDAQESRRDDTLQGRYDALPSRNITQADSREQITDTEEQKQKLSRKRVSKVKTEPTKTDLVNAKHAEFKAAILAYWKYKNGDLPMPWDGSEGAQLGMWMSATPDATLDQVKEMLKGRARSNVNHKDRPRKWIANLTSWAAPVNKFNTPIEEKPQPLAGMTFVNGGAL